VLVITHLPQVAALGKHHLRVSKSQVDGQTLSTIAALNTASRVEEVARMLGGIELTETTRQHAKEMLLG
jgi:DNA repair protein RecN (Recombination protein N)